MAASGKTITVGVNVYVGNQMTLGTGTVTGASKNIYLMANSGTPLVNNGATITLSKIIFGPTSAGSTITVAGGNYGTLTYLVFYGRTNTTFNISGGITVNGTFWVYAVTSTSNNVVNTQVNSINATGLLLGYANITGSSTLNAGASTITIGSGGVSPDSNCGGTQTLTLTTGTINNAGDTRK